MAFATENRDVYASAFQKQSNHPVPILVTAVSNGDIGNSSDENGNKANVEVSFGTLPFRYGFNFSSAAARNFTYDSLEVFFLTPGIYRENANDYECRVLLNGEKTIVPWATIRQFNAHR
jgi:hypothetical protein